MNTSFIDELKDNSNKGQLLGKIVRGPIKTHTTFNEDFYEIMVEVKRLSGNVDILPVTIGERLIGNINTLKEGEDIAVTGEYRSTNKLIEDKSKLLLYFFAKNIINENEVSEVFNEDTNLLKLVGFVCKMPVYRQTPFNRQICDVLVAVNRPNNNKSDYIPCIAWGRNARFVGGLEVGTKVALEGRIQSRPYKKSLPTGLVEDRVAYEVSCKSIAILENQKEENSLFSMTEAQAT